MLFARILIGLDSSSKVVNKKAWTKAIADLDLTQDEPLDIEEFERAAQIAQITTGDETLLAVSYAVQTLSVSKPCRTSSFTMTTSSMPLLRTL